LLEISLLKSVEPLLKPVDSVDPVEIIPLLKPVERLLKPIDLPDPVEIPLLDIQVPIEIAIEGRGTNLPVQVPVETSIHRSSVSSQVPVEVRNRRPIDATGQVPVNL
jgi:hypothetical protein